MKLLSLRQWLQARSSMLGNSFERKAASPIYGLALH